jgi:hypothetical protein
LRDVCFEDRLLFRREFFGILGGVAGGVDGWGTVTIRLTWEPILVLRFGWGLFFAFLLGLDLIMGLRLLL